MRDKHFDLHTLFTTRAAEAEFTEVGRAYVGPKRSAGLDDKVLAWTGYQVCVHSKYLNKVK